MNFWSKLKVKKKEDPIFALAPMANVTDAAFRFMLTKYGKPDVMWTEFVSCDGLMSKGKKNILIDLKFDESERPIVAQIFGSNPDNFYGTALLLQELGFDGIDINMGCPDRTIEKQGAGAALMKEPKLAQKIILETKRGAGKLPVSVKTRIGYSQNELSKWLPNILETEPAAITIHARTRKEMSLVPARWEHVAEAVSIRDKYHSSALILGNGDIVSLEDGKAKAKENKADGVMVGRGIFGNPYFFNPKKKKFETKERLGLLTEHAAFFEKKLVKYKSFSIMKKHFKAYVYGFDGAKELRAKLMEQGNDAKSVKRIIRDFLKSN